MNLNCKSCNTELQGEYCHNCGQKLITKRITVKELIRQFFSSFFNTENGLIFTLKSLITKPHKVVHEYISGKTIKYTNPARFAFFTFAIVGFITVKFGLLDQDIDNFNELTEVKSSESAMNVQAYYIAKIKEFLSIFSFVSIFFFAAIARMLWRSFNYAEHMVLQLYAASLGSIASLITISIVSGKPELIILQYLVTLTIYTIIYQMVFRNNPLVTTIKSIIAFVVGSIFMTLTTGIIFGIVTVIKISLGSSFT